ncbi:MAG: DNA alkylation repair protein [Candidatus Omnitrophota bacterium]
MERLKRSLRKIGNKEKARLLQRFFKTGKGEYAEGDIFLGATVPVLRKLALQFRGLTLDNTILLLKSPIHEERLLALFILILKYKASDHSGKENIYKLYLKHTRFINNWDLVDVTAKHIVGDFLRDRDKAPLYKLARSGSLWERRISIISTFDFIGHHRFDDSMRIAEILLLDPHDLIHKAVGWMLREVGKRDMAREEAFLKKHYKKMPRTMLRYAIEKFPEPRRQAYLKGDIR